MTTLTAKMLSRVETLKAAYAEIILANDGRTEETELEWGQYRRLTTLESYLEERLAR